MLAHWPADYDSYLMEHVVEDRIYYGNKLKERYNQIDQLYNTKTDRPINQTEFYNAYSAVKSRIIRWTLPSNPPEWFNSDITRCGALAPIFDIFNHNYNGNCDWTVNDKGALQVTTIRKVPANSELLFNYGQGTAEMKIFW